MPIETESGSTFKETVTKSICCYFCVYGEEGGGVKAPEKCEMCWSGEFFESVELVANEK